MLKKIISIENLKKITSRLKRKRKKIVLCHGVFDLLHIGHNLMFLMSIYSILNTSICLQLIPLPGILIGLLFGSTSITFFYLFTLIMTLYDY